MAAFTVIMDFKGGTYISQVVAPTPQAALRKWAAELDVRGIADLGPQGKARLVAEATEAGPVPLQGLRAVWCTSLLLP